MMRPREHVNKIISRLRGNVHQYDIFQILLEQTLGGEQGEFTGLPGAGQYHALSGSIV